jgi:hypothetical protein
MTEKDAAIVEHIRKTVGTQGHLTADGMQIFLQLMILDELKSMRTRMDCGTMCGLNSAPELAVKRMLEEDAENDR